MLKNSYLYWKGPSLFNGDEIAVILTGFTIPSSNRKTGPMIQSWILPTQEPPMSAINHGRDKSVCGNCPLRKDSCYVNPVTLNNIAKSDVEEITEYAMDYVSHSGLGLRLGAYGDPAMVPFVIWEPLIKAAKFSLGYTHQWKWAEPEWKKYLQASVESEQEAAFAQSQGWSTFRIKLPDDPVLYNEIVCINQKNKFITCSRCRICNGRKNVVIDIHGAKFKVNNFKNNVLHKSGHQGSAVLSKD